MAVEERADMLDQGSVILDAKDGQHMPQTLEKQGPTGDIVCAARADPPRRR